MTDSSPRTRDPQQVAVRLLLQVAKQACDKKFEEIQFLEDDELIWVKTKAKADEDWQPLLSTSSEIFPALRQCILWRVHFWPEVGSAPLHSNCQQKTKRIWFSPPNLLRLVADVRTFKIAGTQRHTIIFTNIVYEEVPSLIDILELSDSHRELLERGLAAKNGLVLVNKAKASHALDATASISAIRPDAIVLDADTSQLELEELLALAEKSLVLWRMAGRDPVEMLLQLSGSWGEKQKLRERLYGLTQLAVVQQYAKRVCKSCSRSTTIDPRTLERIPKCLRPSDNENYMFGRGCEECGHTAYRGLTNFESIVLVEDEIEQALNEADSASHLTSMVYRKGTRSLLEDGLSKIFAGTISFEEVLSHAPTVSEAFAEVISQPTAKESVSPQNNDNSQMSILIVEDDPNQRAVLEMVFQRQGYQVSGAGNGRDALESLEKHHADLVICDVMMPKMNGGQLVEAIRKSPTLKDTLVLMLTVMNNPDTEYDMLAKGADDYCEKNVKKKVLLKRVERLLARAKPRPLEHLLSE